MPLTDGVVVDTASAEVYVMGDDGLVAITAAGKQRWRTTSAARPLAVSGDLVLAHGEIDAAHRMPLVLLDRKTGKVARTCKSVQLPAWSAGIEAGLGASLTVTGGFDAGGPWTHFEANAWYSGGAPPPPEVEAAAQKAATGTFRCDGKTTTAPGPTEPTVALPAELQSADAVWTGISADGRHALVAVLGDAATYRYDARVYQLSDNALVGSLVDAPYSRPFVVIDGALLTNGEAGVVAIDLATGKQRFAVPLRQVQYLGSYPP